MHLLQASLASQGWEFDAFICHARPDRAFVDLLQAEMLKYGLKTFVDIKSWEGVASAPKTVAHAIVNSPFFVVVLSNNFLNSLNPESEVEAALAFSESHKKILPVFYQMSVDDCLQASKELYHKLTVITGLAKRYRAGTQFAKIISLKVRQMAVEQLESSKLPVGIL